MPELLGKIGWVNVEALRQIPPMVARCRIGEIIPQQPLAYFGVKVQHVVIVYHKYGEGKPRSNRVLEDEGARGGASGRDR